jgi:hypothetical protein
MPTEEDAVPIHMPFDRAFYNSCLDELERGFLRIATVKCDFMHDHTRLSGVIGLLIRANMLLRGILVTLENDLLDSCEAVRRALLETWLLALEFRLGSEQKANEWYKKVPDKWKAHKRTIEKGLQSGGLASIKLGPDIGGLSELAHPTLFAMQNSCILLAARLGNHGDLEIVSGIKGRLETREVPVQMYRHFWLALHESEHLLKIGVDQSATPHAMQFVHRYEDLIKSQSMKG